VTTRQVRFALGGCVGLVALLTIVGIRQQSRIAALEADVQRIAVLEAEAAALRARVEMLARERPGHAPVYFDAAGWSHDRLDPSGSRLPPDPSRIPEHESLPLRMNSPR
jgi:hypothetical protein